MIELIQKFIIPAAYSILPEKMNSEDATVMLLTIGLQESRFKHRIQVNGPAHGFWQFEKNGGCVGVLNHPSSRPHLLNALTKLSYKGMPSKELIYDAIIDNDILAAVCARLLLYTDPRPLPTFNNGPEASWQIYYSVWRPGKPHRETWDAFYAESWNKVKGN